MQRFDAVLFDLGGVLIDLDWAGTTTAFRALVPAESRARADRVFAEIFQYPALHRYERGEIAWDEFRQQLASDTGLIANETDFLAAWNQMIGDFPRQRIERLAELKQRYRLGLLSNTNERHVDCVNGYLREKHAIQSLDSLFHVPLYSHLVGMRKPEPRIYRHAAQALGVDPERILFIDDVEGNAGAATAAGLHGYHLDLERETLFEVLQGL